MLATHETLLKFGKQKKTAHERSVTALAQTASPTAPPDPVPKRQQGDFANFAWTLGIATCPSINLTCLTNSPCSRRIARAPCCSLAAPAARKNNNLLTVSGLFFLRSPAWIGTVSRGPNGRKTELPAVTVRACSPGALPPCPGPALSFPNAPPA